LFFLRPIALYMVSDDLNVLRVLVEWSENESQFAHIASEFSQGYSSSNNCGFVRFHHLDRIFNHYNLCCMWLNESIYNINYSGRTKANL
jgi:hypothetical protein